MPSPSMQLALAEADRARGRTAPNPPVGAVLVRDGAVVGRGHTRPPGQAHAEIVALREAGGLAQGASLYATLEPCCHQGRTPPCTDALIAAGVQRVVAAVGDPNPLVAGQGLARLRAAGIAVEVGDGAAEAAELLQPFFKHIASGLPYVTAKWAMTLDGKIATAGGDSRWVSGPAALAWTHKLRDVVDAVLVGVGTALADDPQLTVRLEGPPRRATRRDRPLRVVLDSRCRLPISARLLSPELAAGTLVYTSSAAPAAARAAVVATGAEVAVVPSLAAGRLDLGAVLADLGRRGLLHVLVEGGAQVHGNLLADGRADELAVVLAPKIVGGSAAPGPVGGAGVERMADALDIAGLRVCRLGDDLLLRGHPAAGGIAQAPSAAAAGASGGG